MKKFPFLLHVIFSEGGVKVLVTLACVTAGGESLEFRAARKKVPNSNCEPADKELVEKFKELNNKICPSFK